MVAFFMQQPRLDHLDGIFFCLITCYVFTKFGV